MFEKSLFYVTIKFLNSLRKYYLLYNILKLNNIIMYRLFWICTLQRKQVFCLNQMNTKQVRNIIVSRNLFKFLFNGGDQI